jgi:hypothetical protein
MEHILHVFLIVAVTFFGMGGVDFFGWKTPFAPKSAKAAYTGKQLRTIEYILGGGTDPVARADNALVYAGASWDSTKGGAGTKVITIPGTGIRVVNAYVDVGFIVASAVSVANIGLMMDVRGASSQGTDARISEELSSSPYNTSGLSGYIHSTHDATSLFQLQGDTEWNAGIPVVAALQVDLSAAGNIALATMKLVITYESDYSAIAHTEAKTVRFPLRSVVGTDSGTRQNVCSSGALCAFTYFAELPDLNTSADLLSVAFEMHGEIDSGAASTFTVGSASGTATSTFSWTEALVDDTTVYFTMEATSSWQFATGTSQRLHVLMGAVPATVLGGELVVTYRYSTDAPRQTETVRYFLAQRTTAPGTSKNYFSTTSVTIVQTQMRMEALWYRVHIAPTASTSFSIFAKVGTSSEQSKTYAITSTNPRAGNTPTIVHDLSSLRENFYQASTILGGATQYTSAGGSPPAIEAYLTFTWNGQAGVARTQSVTFSGAQQGSKNTLNTWANRSVILELPETAPKTYRSVYLKTALSHSQTTSITIGTVTIGANGSTTAIAETADATSEAYNAVYFHLIASTTFSNGGVIDWNKRAILLNQTLSVSNIAHWSNQIVVTYDADFSQDAPMYPPKQVKTVEFLMASSSDNTVRGDNIIAYAGETWSGTKAGAGKRRVTIAGSGIRVLNAYLEVSYLISTTVNVNHEFIVMDVEGASSQGFDVQVGGSYAVSPYNSSGLGGYVLAQHDVTALFDRQTDTQWNTGIGVVAGVQIDFSAAANRILTTVRLVITYESNYTLVPHDEVKTVRFPLDSVDTNDRGTRQGQCAAATTCVFAYTADIPDAVADGDILEAYFDLSGEVDSATASTLQPGITGGTAGPAFNWQETNLDDTHVRILWAPPVGGTNFQRNASQTLGVTLGSVPMNVLGGELVVTYRYSTGAPRQTETVRYMMDQRLTAPGTTKNAIATTTIVVQNGGYKPSNIWFRVHVAPTASSTLRVFGKVGTSTEKSLGFAFTGVNPRSGNSARIIYDMTDDIGNLFATSTDIAGYTQWNAGGAPPGVEAWVTFTWDGNLGGPVTKSVSFGATQQGVVDGASYWNNRPVTLFLPENVTKRYRSSYLLVTYNHSDTTSITAGTMTFGINGTTSVVAESSDGTNEAYTERYFHRIASSTFSSVAPIIDWTARTFEIVETRSVINEGYYANEVIVTYDADFDLKVPRFFQNYFRFYVDNNLLTPADPWPAGAENLGENTDVTLAGTPPKKGENVRLRMSVRVATTTMVATTTQFKLQYGERELLGSCATIGTWSDLGAPGSGAIWRGVAATPANGQALSGDPPVSGSILLSVSDRAGRYQEQNPTALNPFNVAVNEDVEYDWNIESNNAPTSTPYCFRMVSSDGALFDEYSYYPTLWTAGYVPESRNWRWYDDETNVTPVVPLAAENVAPTDINNGSIVKLRITVDETNAENGVNQKFFLQYSTVSDFSSGVYDVAATSTCTPSTGWCYADAAGTDNQVIAGRVLTDSSANGTHNEAPTTTSAFGPTASTPTEFEFTITHSGAAPNTTYFFRLYDYTNGHPVVLASGKTYPSLTTGGTTLTFTVSGLATSTVTEGVTTDVATDPESIRYGTLPFSTPRTAAQRLSISTNATRGYQIFLGAKQAMMNAYGDSIPAHQGTNAAPLSWSAGCPSALTGCFGYHAGDDTLAGGSTRFLADDTYAGFTTSAEEVAFHSTLTAGDVIDVVIRLLVRQQQQAGRYTTQLYYVVVPIY